MRFLHWLGFIIFQLCPSLLSPHLRRRSLVPIPQLTEHWTTNTANKLSFQFSIFYMCHYHTHGMICCKFWLVTCDQEDRIHWCSITGGHFFTRHPLVLARRGLCWQKLSDRITQPFSVLLRQDTSRVLTPLPHVLEHWKFAKIQVTCRCLDYVQY